MGDKGREKIAKALDDWKDEEFLEGGVADVTHHPIPPKHDQGMHRAPTEPSRNRDDFLPLIVPF